VFDVSVFEVDFVEDAVVEGLLPDLDVVECCVTKNRKHLYSFSVTIRSSLLCLTIEHFSF